MTTTTENPAAASPAAQQQKPAAPAAGAAPAPQADPGAQPQAPPAPQTAEDLDAMVPDEPTAMRLDWSSQIVYLYGPGKIGKSSLANLFPGSIFLPFDPGDGLKHFQHYQIPKEGVVQSWKEIRPIYNALKTDKARARFKTIVCDTVDEMLKLCSAYVCQQKGVQHPSEMKQGAGYGLVYAAFETTLKAFTKLGYGVVLIGHSQEKEFESGGLSWVRTVPTVSEGARKFLVGLCDIIMLYRPKVEEFDAGDGKVGQRVKRVLLTKPHSAYDAGDRTGLLPAEIDMGNTAEDGWAALSAAYAEGLRRKASGAPIGTPAAFADMPGVGPKKRQKTAG